MSSELITVSDLVYQVGMDISNKNSVQVGTKTVEYIRQHAPKNLVEYIDVFHNNLEEGIRNFIRDNVAVLDHFIKDNKVTSMSWMPANTFRVNYLTKLISKHEEGIYIESIEQCWLRVACFYRKHEGVEQVLKCYKHLLDGHYTPPSPVIYNGGKTKGTTTSCFLFKLDDTKESILETIHLVSHLSMSGGGIGVDLSALRDSDFGDEGKSSGPAAWGKVIDGTTCNISQNSRRSAVSTLYMSWYNLTINDFVMRAALVDADHGRTYFTSKTAIWISYLFLRRVYDNAEITLFDSKYAAKLDDLYGDEFNKAYTELEKDETIPSQYRLKINAYDLWMKIARYRSFSGTPFVLNFDAGSIKSNHSMIESTQRVSSNLCTEMFMRIPKIRQPDGTVKRSVAVCNLSSLNLEMYPIKPYNGNLLECFNFELLGECTRDLVVNINNAIDNNSKKEKLPLFTSIIKDPIGTTNLLDKALGVGVMGFIEMIYTLDLDINSEEVTYINKVVFACIYWNCIVQSVQLAVNKGKHLSFGQTPLSRGLFDFDLWNKEAEYIKNSKYLYPNGPDNFAIDTEEIKPIQPVEWGCETLTFIDKKGKIVTSEATWENLSFAVIKYGAHNSLFTTIMPTATSSQIRDTYESVELPQSNLYMRTTSAGNFIILNRHLESDLREMNLWSDEVLEFIKDNNGSVKGLTQFLSTNNNLTGEQINRLQFLERKYISAFEIKQSRLIELMKDRSVYLSHGASFSSYFPEAKMNNEAAFLTKSGLSRLKTLGYYSRLAESVIKNSNSKSDNVEESFNSSFSNNSESVEPDSVEDNINNKPKSKIGFVCTDDVCTSCSS